MPAALRDKTGFTDVMCPLLHEKLKYRPTIIQIRKFDAFGHRLNRLRRAVHENV
jgi:hypothetical protein